MQLKISSEIYTFPVPATASFLALFCLRELRPFPDTLFFSLSQISCTCHRFIIFTDFFKESLDDFLRCDGLQWAGSHSSILYWRIMFFHKYNHSSQPGLGYHSEVFIIWLQTSHLDYNFHCRLHLLYQVTLVLLRLHCLLWTFLSFNTLNNLDDSIQNFWPIHQYLNDD